MTIVAPAATYLLAWAAALVTNILALVHQGLALVAPADVAEFVSRSYVFSGLCLVIVALITNGTRILIWWMDNGLRKERDSLLRDRQRSLAAHPTENI